MVRFKYRKDCFTSSKYLTAIQFLLCFFKTVRAGGFPFTISRQAIGRFGFCPAFAVLFLCFVFTGCKGPAGDHPAEADNTPKLFTLVDSASTGIDFRNDVIEDEYTNPLVYEYTHNGGGVAVGDVNNDGLDDIFFTANKKRNELYLNRGNFKFQNITNESGTAGRDASWKTGVTMADVNGDSLLDIYVCYSGNLPGFKRGNELLINKGNGKNGIPVFKDEAVAYGLADSAFSTHAAFFDYDHDGDLDMILLNHCPRRFENLDDSYLAYLKNKKDSLTGVKLYQNTGTKFVEVTEKSGILNSRLSYGLGISVSDVNNDGWPDIYLSNDYMAADYLYINNHNGTFTERLGEMIGYTSEFSMGNDISDINNDGYQDIYTLDMLPEDNHRQKLLSANDNYEYFELRNRNGLHPQFMRNMLHVNNGDNTFSEVAQMTGVSNTDWSWAPLFADYDNDGWKDLFVTNGYVHDYTNLDFLKYMGDFLRDNRGNVRRETLLELARKMPSSNVVNYIFRNKGGENFENVSSGWGFDKPSNSNGAAYADLDNDGDLDLVVNNVNENAFVYRNDENTLSKNNWLAVKLSGSKKNTLGVGATVNIWCNNKFQSQEQLVSRGYESSVSPILHFGLAKDSVIDSLQITWPSGKTQWLKNTRANRQLVLKETDAMEIKKSKIPGVTPLFKMETGTISWSYKENDVNDFKRQPLMPASLSYNGPCMAKGDINNDGLEDIFIGSASGELPAVFIQLPNGSFKITMQPSFESDLLSEDAAAVFFDADKDGDNDLYVCSGGYDNFLPTDPLLQDRLYLNDGKGNFSKASHALPALAGSKSCVAVADINKDGFNDLFIGGRVIPGRYPETGSSYILMNDGKGHFTDQSNSIAKELTVQGRITAAVFADINQDRIPDLVTAGDFMPIQIWINENGKLTEKTKQYFDNNTSGCWNTIAVDDVNNDGQPDIIAGNMGLNTQLKCSEKEPAELWYKDFDDNGSVDPILCYYIQGKSYPMVSRDELLDQVSSMRGKFTDYKSYADATINDVFTAAEMEGAKKLTAVTFKTTCFISSKEGKYREALLPLKVQEAPVYAISVLDADSDGKKDIVLAGNVSHARLKFGYCRAGHGTLLKGNGDGNFSLVSLPASGLRLDGDTRSILTVGKQLIVGMNNDFVQSYKF